MRSPVPRAIGAIRAGNPVLVLDGDPAAAEGNLTFAAALATRSLVAFAVRHTSGFLRVAIPAETADRLRLPSMHASSADTVTVDARSGISTGISAHDRATTIRLLADPTSGPAAFARPGHVVPCRVRAGGVLHRPSPAEAAADLAELAGLSPAAVFAPVVSRADPAHLARTAELRAFGETHQIAVISIDDLAIYRRRVEPAIDRVSSWVTAAVRAARYRGRYSGGEHLAWVYGDIGDGEAIVTHVDTICPASALFCPPDCGCADRLRCAQRAVADEGRGVIVVSGQEGSIEETAQILLELGLRSVRLVDGSVIAPELEERGLLVKETTVR